MALMTDIYNAKEGYKSLHMLNKMYKKTKLDGNFQRYGGVLRGSGWSIKDGKAYIENFLQGGTFNNIIVVSARDALSYGEEIKCIRTIKYFTAIIEEGYEYVSVDGNNSTSFLSFFISDHEDLKIKHPSYNEKVGFSNLTEEDQEDVKYTEKINVIVLRNITVDAMCDLFRSLNTQTKLNAQEHRQARISPLSTKIRELGESSKDFFTSFIFTNTQDLDKRSHEELIAQMAFKLEVGFSGSGKGAIKSALDKFYEETNQLRPETIKQLDYIFKLCSDVTKKLETPLAQKLKKGQIMNFLDVIQIVRFEEKFDIVDVKGFLSWYLEKNREFRESASCIPEAEREQKSYSFWSHFYVKKNSWTNIRTLFKSKFAESAEKLSNEGVIKPVRTSKSTFTFQQKLELMKLQNYETRMGDKIDILDLYLGKFEADHVKSVKDGGETSLKNGELMTVKENRKKGSRSNSPYFLYQQTKASRS